MNVRELNFLLADDMAAVDALILKQLPDTLPLLKASGYALVENGGKRIRPLLTLLVARLIELEDTQAIAIATLIELIHIATLLHDDVVDDATLRRGQPTLKITEGNAASILTGDFFYTRAFQMMTELGSLPLLTFMANSTNTIAKGEVMQLITRGNLACSIEHYFDIIEQKTAHLFTAAVVSPAIFLNSPTDLLKALHAFGMHLGLAFQLRDDLLDYTGTTDELGKAPGTDFKEGNITLPLIDTLAHASPEERAYIEFFFNHPDLQPDLNYIRAVMDQYDALGCTKTQIQYHAKLAREALAELPKNEYKKGLMSIVEATILQ